MAKFRKKPVVVEAVRWDGTNVCDIREFFDAFLMWHLNGCDEVRIETLEGIMSAHIGGWIIKGVKGEFYPCKPDIFEATYDPAPAALPTPDFNRAISDRDDLMHALADIRDASSDKMSAEEFRTWAKTTAVQAIEEAAFLQPKSFTEKPAAKLRLTRCRVDDELFEIQRLGKNKMSLIELLCHDWLTMYEERRRK